MGTQPCKPRLPAALLVLALGVGFATGTETIASTTAGGKRQDVSQHLESQIHNPGRKLLGSNSLTSDKDLIGWLGERPPREQQGSNERWMEVLAWDPKIFLFHGFLIDEECDYLVQNAKPRLARSGVSDSETGAGKLSDIRTSSGMFYGRGENAVVKAIEDRIARWTMVPAGNGEGIQVLRYEKSQKYSPHHDYFSFEGSDANGGNRLVTVLMYLSDVEEGGETVFPKVPVPANQTAAAGYSECAMKGLAYKPRKGDAIAFWSINNDGRFEPKSLHGSCPVIKGEKWSATKWVHVGHYAGDGEVMKEVKRVIYVPPPPPATPGCINRHKLCNHWAESGECESNPTYMLGTKDHPGDCIAACNRCDLGPNDPAFSTISHA